MDSVSTLSNAAAKLATGNSDSIKVPYGASISGDVAAFESSLDAAAQRASASSEMGSDIAKAAFEPLDFLNKEAQSLGDYAKAAVEAGNTLSPGEIVSLTVQSQKFMFHSQLTANIANRTADGVQQLFRQQG